VPEGVSGAGAAVHWRGDEQTRCWKAVCLDRVSQVHASAGYTACQGHARERVISAIQPVFNAGLPDLSANLALVEHRRLLALLVALPDMLFEVDDRGCLLFCHAPPDSLLSSPADFIGKCLDQVLPEPAAGICMAALAQARSQGEVTNVRYTLDMSYGTRCFDLSMKRQPGLDGPVLYTALVRDVTSQRAVQEQQQLAALVYQHCSEAMMVTDDHNRIVDVNPAFTEITGYSRAEVLGQDPRLLSSGRHSAAFYQDLWQTLQTSGCWQGELWNRRKDGEVYPQWLSVSTAYHEDGQVYRRVALFSDVTEKKRAQDLIWRQANFDLMTNLPNRRLFEDRLQQEMRRTARAGSRLALLFLDLDRFKEINDSLGHDAGDLLLQQAARRIEAQVRSTDTVARLAGDEFTVILPNLEDQATIERIAQGILKALCEPFELLTHAVGLSVSIGITVFPDDARSTAELLQNADQAMYLSKRKGRNQLTYFTLAMQEQSQKNRALVLDFRQAMLNGELCLHYQPVVDLRSGELHKVEALLRWFSPTRGQVPTAEFIAVAQEGGLMHQLGDWVMQQAISQVKRWSVELGQSLRVALNVSPLQLRQAGIHKMRWQEQLELGGMGGHNFVIEVASDMLHDPSVAVHEQMKAFEATGTRLSVNLRVAGYATFSAIRRLPVEFFKIDREITARIVDDADERALARAVVLLAQQLGLKVIAEGVETLQQHWALRDMGCDFGQGFLYAQPLSANEVVQMFAPPNRRLQPSA